MKKKTLTITVLFSVLSIICLFHARMMKQKESLDPTILANIEALANNESETKVICVGEGSTICPATGERVAYYIVPSNYYD